MDILTGVGWEGGERELEPEAELERPTPGQIVRKTGCVSFLNPEKSGV